MKLWPYRRFVLQSPLSPDEVARVLRDSVDPRPQWDNPGRPFVGSVTPPEFRIHRAIGYRNSFLPRVVGRIIPGDNGSHISITMRLHPAAAIFMALWLGGTALIGVPLAVATFADGGGAALIPACMLLFGGLLTIVAFSAEARIAKKILRSLLDGTELATQARERPRRAYR